MHIRFFVLTLLLISQVTPNADAKSFSYCPSSVITISEIMGLPAKLLPNKETLSKIRTVINERRIAQRELTIVSNSLIKISDAYQASITKNLTMADEEANAIMRTFNEDDLIQLEKDIPRHAKYRHQLNAIYNIRIVSLLSPKQQIALLKSKFTKHATDLKFITPEQEESIEVEIDESLVQTGMLDREYMQIICEKVLGVTPLKK